MTYPARLHVLLATDAPVGVVLRRGPSRFVATLLWNRRTDEFKLGQWVRARVYERRADLSPDGRYLIYFAMNGYWDTITRGSYTAVSRAPYLKALVLLGKGDTWNGGGLFTGHRTYWVNDGYGHEPLRDSSEVRRDLTYEPVRYPYHVRLERGGWTRYPAPNLRTPTIFERTLPHGWVLRKRVHNTRSKPVVGGDWDEHDLVPPGGADVVPYPDWDWADRDGDDLVYAEAGGLYRAKVRTGGLVRPTLLRDFTDMTFKPAAAPY